LQGVWQIIADFLWKKPTILFLIIGIDDSHKDKIEEECSEAEPHETHPTAQA